MLCTNKNPLDEAVQMNSYYICFHEKIRNTVFNLITARTPISTQSRNSVVFRLQPVYLKFPYFFIKAYVVGTHLNCIDLSMQFK